jgi:4'-phosphopantetheinyl transferase
LKNPPAFALAGFSFCDSLSLSSIALPISVVHLWVASMSETFAQVRLEDLSTGEQNKAKTLKNEEFRKRFSVSAWLTRHILAKYEKQTPGELDFAISESGKPFLQSRLRGKSAIEFNRSHSGDVWVLAVARDAAVGVDIEQIRPRAQMEAIVQRWFEPTEREQFLNLPEDEKILFFHQSWTQKEAVLKVWGVGLVRLTDYAAYAAKTWNQPLVVSPGFAGCIAATDGMEISGSKFSSFPSLYST